MSDIVDSSGRTIIKDDDKHHSHYGLEGKDASFLSSRFTDSHVFKTLDTVREEGRHSARDSREVEKTVLELTKELLRESAKTREDMRDESDKTRALMRDLEFTRVRDELRDVKAQLLAINASVAV